MTRVHDNISDDIGGDGDDDDDDDIFLIPNVTVPTVAIFGVYR